MYTLRTNDLDLLFELDFIFYLDLVLDLIYEVCFNFNILWTADKYYYHFGQKRSSSAFQLSVYKTQCSHMWHSLSVAGLSIDYLGVWQVQCWQSNKAEGNYLNQMKLFLGDCEIQRLTLRERERELRRTEMRIALREHVIGKVQHWLKKDKGGWWQIKKARH